MNRRVFTNQGRKHQLERWDRTELKWVLPRKGNTLESLSRRMTRRQRLKYSSHRVDLSMEAQVIMIWVRYYYYYLRS